MPRSKNSRAVEAPKRVSLLDQFVASAEYGRMSLDQPVTTDLVINLLKRTDELNCLIDRVKTEVTAERRKQMWWTMQHLEEEIASIGTWLFGPVPSPSPAEYIAELNRHVEMWSPELALQYMDAQRTGRPGRQPTTSRAEGLKAADERKKSPKLPWSEIANHVCGCGKSRHDRKCAERMRSQTNELDVFMARLNA